MAGDGQALLAGVQGFQQGYDYMTGHADRKREIARQAEADQWEREDRAARSEERALRMEDLKLSRKQRQAQMALSKLTMLGQSGAPEFGPAVEQFYKDYVDDGIELPPGSITPTGDGRWTLRHPQAEAETVGTWDQLIFGTRDPQGGLTAPGLYHGAFPQALLDEHIAGQEQQRELAVAGQKHQYELDEIGARNAGAAHAAQIRAGATLTAAQIRAQAAQAGVGRAPALQQEADGGQMMWDPRVGAYVPAPALDMPADGMGPPGVRQLTGRVPEPRAGADPIGAAVQTAARASLDGTQVDIENRARAQLDAAANLRATTAGVGPAPPKGSAASQPRQPGAAQPSANPDASGFVPGQEYTDDQGNRAVYLGNGQWREIGG